MLPDLIHLMTRTVTAAERALAASLHGLCTNAGKLAGGLVGSAMVALIPIPVVLTGLSAVTFLTVSGAAVRRSRAGERIAG